MPVPVVIANAVPVYTLGLSNALSDAGFSVETTNDLAAWLCHQRHAAALIGVHGEQDFDLVRRLTVDAPESTVVTLTDTSGAEAFGASLLAGARGSVPQDAEPAEVVRTLEAALTERTLMPTPVAQALAAEARPPLSISKKQATWLQALAAGRTVGEVARTACFSEREMHRRLRQLYESIGASSRTEAIVKAVRAGVVR